jgi:hypothetical protein
VQRVGVSAAERGAHRMRRRIAERSNTNARCTSLLADDGGALDECSCLSVTCVGSVICGGNLSKAVRLGVGLGAAGT